MQLDGRAKEDLSSQPDGSKSARRDLLGVPLALSEDALEHRGCLHVGHSTSL